MTEIQLDNKAVRHTRLCHEKVGNCLSKQQSAYYLVVCQKLPFQSLWRRAREKNKKLEERTNHENKEQNNAHDGPKNQRMVL